MNTISNKMVCVAQALAAKAKGELAEKKAKLEVLGAANLLAQALVQALAEAQNCKTLRELREQVEERMVDVREDHDTAWVLNTLRAYNMYTLADNINGMLTSIVCIMNCKRHAEMREHFQYFRLRKAGAFHAIRRFEVLATTDARIAQATLERWTKMVCDHAKNRLPAVAVNRVAKQLAIAQHHAVWTDYSTGKSCYWQPLQSARYPFRMWVMACNFTYRMQGMDISA